MRKDDSTVVDRSLDWASDRWRTFDFKNLGSLRNLWAILVGSFFAVGLPVGFLGVWLDLSPTVGGFIFWPLYVVMVAIAILAVGSTGVVRCRSCGAMLRKGTYACRRCANVSAPRVMR